MLAALRPCLAALRVLGVRWWPSPDVQCYKQAVQSNFLGVSMRCSNCGSDNPAGKRFCGDCGTPLDSPGPIPPREPRGPLPGERRHLTVLFCDLVGSTEIAARLDPEEWREIVASYHRTTTEAITRFGGYVAQYLGDGVMAYFGWPEAHDNNAERAARAGLLILDAIPK